MKKIYFLIAQTFCVCTLFAQSQGTINGQISTPDGVAEYATVMALSAIDSSLVKAGYSDVDGHFEVGPVKAGQYFLKITFIGFDDYQSNVFSISEGVAFTVPSISLITNTHELDEVVVKAKKPLVEIQPDKTVFNVEGSINATGNDALELLRKAPGIVVDNNDNVILQGKSGVQIYINNKPSYLTGDDLANFLKGMQSTEIEAIEIITNPSSKYEAEGNAGIINIRIKKNKNFGTNANINAGYSYGIFSRYNSSVSLNNRNEKSSLFATYGNSTGLSYNYNDFYREQNGFQLDQHNRETSEFTNQNYRVGADFYLGDKSTIGVMSNGYFSNRDETSKINTEIATLDNQEVFKLLHASGDNMSARQNLNFNLNYRFDNKNGSTINIDADYGYFNNENNNNQPNTYLEPDGETIIERRDFLSITPTTINIYTAKIDYERPALKGTLSIGAKVSYVNTDNTFDFFNIVDGGQIRNIDRSNDFSYLENVTAGYINYQTKIEKWAFQVGLRGEQTHSDGMLTAYKPDSDDQVVRDYFDIFPSAGVTYDLNKKNSFRLSYSYRIDRPKYQDLNPFEYQLDELTFQRGNAFLNPQYTGNIQLSHTFNYRLNTSLSYSKTTDQMAEVTDRDPRNELAGFITQLNVAEQDVISLTVSYPTSITKWWNIFTNVNAYHTQINSDYGAGKVLDLNANVLSLYLQNTISLPKEYSFELSGFYNSPSIFGSIQANKMWAMDAGIQKKLWNGRANIKVSISDIFKTQQWGGISTFGGFYINAKGGWESRRLKFNFSYLIGNNEVKSARKRNTGLEDESNRIKG